MAEGLSPTSLRLLPATPTGQNEYQSKIYLNYFDIFNNAGLLLAQFPFEMERYSGYGSPYDYILRQGFGMKNQKPSSCVTVQDIKQFIFCH